LILFLVMHGPIATNILNLYSATLAALSLDIKAARWKVSVFVSIIGTVALIVFIESNNFATNFDNWIASVVVWIAAWGGVMLIDFYVVRGGTAPRRTCARQGTNRPIPGLATSSSPRRARCRGAARPRASPAPRCPRRGCSRPSSGACSPRS
jgi:purine-cytosine permease-like protein